MNFYYKLVKKFFIHIIPVGNEKKNYELNLCVCVCVFWSGFILNVLVVVAIVVNPLQSNYDLVNIFFFNSLVVVVIGLLIFITSICPSSIIIIDDDDDPILWMGWKN